MSDEVWVVVETHKGVGEMFSYRGRTTVAAFEAWKAGTLGGTLPLSDAYWMEQRGGQIVPYVVGRRGDYKNATGTIHVLASTIMVMMELDGPDAGVTDDDSNATVLSLAGGTGRRAGGPRALRNDPPEPPTSIVAPPVLEAVPMDDEAESDDDNEATESEAAKSSEEE